MFRKLNNPNPGQEVIDIFINANRSADEIRAQVDTEATEEASRHFHSELGRLMTRSDKDPVGTSISLDRDRLDMAAGDLFAVEAQTAEAVGEIVDIYWRSYNRIDALLEGREVRAVKRPEPRTPKAIAPNFALMRDLNSVSLDWNLTHDLTEVRGKFIGSNLIGIFGEAVCLESNDALNLYKARGGWSDESIRGWAVPIIGFNDEQNVDLYVR